MRIDLPWPDSKLSPNARIHWAQKAKIAASHRQCAYVSCLAKSRRDYRDALKLSNNLRAMITFYPPDRRKRDLDNLHASCKFYLDGIAQAFGFDDSKIKWVNCAWGNDLALRVIVSIDLEPDNKMGVA